MNKNEADMEPDIKTAAAREETILMMEPLLVAPDSRFRGELNDLAIDLAARAAGFCRMVPEGLQHSLAELVRAVNCYYSNVLEGRDARPSDIDWFLKKEYSTESRKSKLHLEALAHIKVLEWIDKGGLAGRTATIKGISEIHRRLGEHLPEELLWAENPGTGERIRVIPGAFRDRDVRSGRQVPVSSWAMPRFLARFEQVYSRLGRSDTLVGLAAAHHRLLWIHPFFNENGRIARIVAHAALLETLGSGGIWPMERGLARNAVKYRTLLANCDQQRRNPQDGRGYLSEEALAEFSRFFLLNCLEQIDFMEGLVQPERLRHRLLAWAAEEATMGTLPPRSEPVLDALLYRGVLPRGEVPILLNIGERQARRVISVLLEQKVLTSASSRAPLFLAFPAPLVPRWLPGLFPE